MRNSPDRLPPNPNCFTRLKSRFVNLGPRMSPMLRVRVPNVLAAGDVNTDVSNHWRYVLSGLIVFTISASPVWFGRCVLSGVLSAALLIVMSSGWPDCSDRMPETCQPPSTQCRTPASLFLYHGSDHTNDDTKTCVRSKFP